MSDHDQISFAAEPDFFHMSASQFLATVPGEATVLPQSCPPGHYVVTVERDGRESALSHIAPVASLDLRMRAVMDTVERHLAADAGTHRADDGEARAKFVTRFLAPMMIEGRSPDCMAGRTFGAQLVEFYIFERILEAGHDPADFFKEGAGVFLDIKTNAEELSETLYLQALPISRVN